MHSCDLGFLLVSDTSWPPACLWSPGRLQLLSLFPTKVITDINAETQVVTGPRCPILIIASEAPEYFYRDLPPSSSGKGSQFWGICDVSLQGIRGGKDPPSRSTESMQT